MFKNHEKKLINVWVVEAMGIQGHRLWNRYFWWEAQSNRGQEDFFYGESPHFFPVLSIHIYIQIGK